MSQRRESGNRPAGGEEGSVLLKNEAGILPSPAQVKLSPSLGLRQRLPRHGPLTASARRLQATNRPSVACTPITPLDAITTRLAQDAIPLFLITAVTWPQCYHSANADIAIVFGYYVR